jgi:rhodanese-related sulfurtransferase
MHKLGPVARGTRRVGRGFRKVTTSIRDVGLDELAAGLDEGSIALVDVREPHEFVAGHIPGSISLPLSLFDPAALPLKGRVVFTCAAGVRSKTAIEFCRQAGLEWSEHYPGGFKGWLAAGGPVQTGED